jgi:hypothetical protein
LVRSSIANQRPALWNEPKTVCTRNSQRGWSAPKGLTNKVIAQDALARFPRPSGCIFYKMELPLWGSDSDLDRPVQHVRSTPDSDLIADIAGGPVRATS